MDLEREKRFHHLLAKALDHEADERRRFLASACGDDRRLLDELSRAVALNDHELGQFLETPALARGSRCRKELLPASSGAGARASSPSPPTSLLARLRATRWVTVFLLLVAALSCLAIAAATGASAIVGAAHSGIQFSPLNGKIRWISESWTNVRWDDEIVGLNGIPVDGEPEKIRAALLELEPGPVSLRLRRGNETLETTGRAVAATSTMKIVTWTRVVTGAILLAIGTAAFLLRPGNPVTWLFLFFCSALSFHLLVFMALLRHPPEGIVAESIGLYLTASCGLHLFTVFPQRLIRRGSWAFTFYLPTLAACLVLIPAYHNPSQYPLVAQVIMLGAIFSAAAAFAGSGLVLLQVRRARRRENAIAQARSRALLVAVFFGLALPALLGATRWIQHEVDWMVDSFLVVVFVVLTAYSLVRHNALEVDRFTAAVLGYSTTTVLLTMTFGATLVGLSALLGQAAVLRSPVTSAVSTAAFFVLFQPFYRRVRQKVDRWFLREQVEDEGALRRLRQLADVVRTADLSETFRVGLETTMFLHGERAELWGRTPEGSSFVRLHASDGADRTPGPMSQEGPLIQALNDGSGGVDGLVDRTLDPAAQHELWSHELALAAPVFAHDQLHGFLALSRKRNGTAYTRQERAFLDTVASHVGIAIERGWEETGRVGPYRLLGRLGIGGMAEVYLAEKHGPGGFELRVAMKRILPHLSQDPDCVTMFLDEARIAAHLSHPNIVAIYDIEKYEGTYYLAMEFIDGPTLAALIRAASKRRTRLPLSVVATIVDAMLSALEYAHRKKDRRGQLLGLVHRDVKPGNILLGRHGEIKLTDFGIARVEFRLHQTRPGLALGTPAYMAPEQHDGGTIGPWTDLYSAGVVIYEMLSGRRAFAKGRHVSPPPLTQFAVSQALDDFVRCALAKRPEERFPSAGAMRTAFLAAIGPTLPASREEVAAVVTAMVPAERRRGPRLRGSDPPSADSVSPASKASSNTETLAERRISRQVTVQPAAVP